MAKIGWRVDGGRLSPTTEPVRELFFPQGTQHDAYVEIRDIIRKATCSLYIIDPYLDETIFTILGDAQRSLKVQLLTAKLPSDFANETVKFRQQYRDIHIEIRRSKNFHDRFIIIDETKCWHIGCSIKDAGNKAFMLSQIEDQKNSQPLLHTLSNTWKNAMPHT